jgi:L-threonylcarbamoyladenylate synthase
MGVGNSVDEAVAWLRREEPVALPTETVYGLAAPLWSPRAIDKIYVVKGRPKSNPLIVHVLDLVQCEGLAHVGRWARELCKHFWPGPLTLVLPKKKNVPDTVTAGGPNVAVRSPSQPVFRAVLSALGQPIVAPSANRFAHLSPTRAEHVQIDLGDAVSYILDGGPCTLGVESTVLSLVNENAPEILRHGPIPAEELETVLLHSIRRREDEEWRHRPSPGLFKKHYSPQKRLVLYDRIPRPCPEWVTPVFFRKPADENFGNALWLVENDDLAAAARRLFEVLREADLSAEMEIWAERVPNRGVGLAINERLERASAEA